MSEIARQLSKRTLELLELSDAERLAHIDKPFFIPYQKASELLAEMEDLLEHPKTNRMPNLLIVGRSDNGKTEILREFLHRHPAEDRAGLDSVFAPVIYIQSPPGPSEHIFLNNLLMLLGATVRTNDSADRKLLQLLAILPRLQTKVLMVDELNALLAGSATKQRFLLNMLKFISNELQICIVAAGTLEAEHAIRSDAQLQSRFPMRALPRWQQGEDFRRLLYNFEYLLPLKQPSEIYKGEIASKLYGLSEGVIGEVAKILRSAARYAIQSHEERISIDVISKCTYVSRKGDVRVELL
ncbi:TniB family NTP-binding protein [Methylomonas fluvii]|uniref:TniB family NTP-binding protein n=1 Tax=Methylomonas fluvii TaxID=1854564 RepID=A0ABR9DAX5_9GAMM|nr:TniB family NTP-binding protein [Methylomonas fluvii]MBD9359936.1 TniB family NTP-binding protein [Methylomonas fluvii]